jgi:hypothetical protein
MANPRRKTEAGKTEAEASITNKLKRGSFPATFFLAVLAALELDGVALLLAPYSRIVRI